MDILEKYSPEEIKEINDLVQAQLFEGGICEALNYMEMAKYTISRWKQYQEEREIENEQNPEILTEDEKKLIKERNLDENFFKSMKMISQTDVSPKMPEEEEEALKNESEIFEKYWDIIGNDSSIQELLVDEIKQLRYDEKDTKSRVQNIRCILSILNILDMDEENEKDEDDEYTKWNKLYETILEKMQELNFEDFEIVYRNTKNDYDMLFNKKAKDTIIKIINNMDIAQFSYFLVSMDELVNHFDEEIWKVIIDRIRKEDSALLNSTYEFIYEPDRNEEIRSLNVLDKLKSLHAKRFDGVSNARKYLNMNFGERKKYETELPQNESFKEYLKVLSELTPKEFVRYMLYHREHFIPYLSMECNRLTDAIPEEEKVIVTKLQELSDLDIKVLLNKFNVSKERKNDNIEMWDKNINNIKKSQIPEVVDKLRCYYSIYTYLILKEALKRKLLTQELKPTYPQDEGDVQDEYAIFEDINEALLFDGYPNEINFYFEGNPEADEEEFQDENEMYEKDKQAMQKFEDDLEVKVEIEEESIIREVKILKRMHDFSCMTDIDFCKYVNYFNSNIPESKIKEFEYPLIYYIKRRIISLPTKYAHFLEYKENGCLNDAIEVKTGELEAMRFFDTNDEKEI